MAKSKSHLEWESSKDEKYAEKWWTDHEFTWALKKRFISYSQYEISKDGITMEYDIPNVPNADMKRFLEGPAGFLTHWKMYCELQALRKQKAIIETQS